VRRLAHATTRRQPPSSVVKSIAQCFDGGDEDMCQPPARSRAVAELTGGELVVLQGGGHLPNARDPVKVNLEIDRFLRRIELGCRSTTRGRAPISWTLVAAG